MTLNQIIQKIKTASESHKMVGKFGVGQQSNMTVENINYYPLVWLYPDGFNLGSNLLTYNFSLLVMDRVFEDESNVLEVLSDSAQLVADIFALIDDNTRADEDFELVLSSQATPFYDAKTDILSGYAINFKVNTPYLYNTCVVPV